jgi:hypothetical protein
LDLVTIAIAVSRVEAAVVAGMLEGYGIRVHIGGYAQGTLEFNALALGGYRLWVAEADWHAASEILRQSAASAPDSFMTGPRRAILRFWAIALAPQLALILPALMSAGTTAAAALLVPLSTLFMPVNPQGRADYFLAPSDEDKA